MKKVLTLMILVVMSLGLLGINSSAANSFSLRITDYNNNDTYYTYDTSDYSMLNPSNRPGYRFDGYTSIYWSGVYTSYDTRAWLDSNYQSEIEDQVRITQSWTYMGSYTVTFLDWDDSVLSSQSILYSNSATLPADPTRSGYTFAYWQGSYTNVTSNRTIYAIYTQNPQSTYTVTFRDWDTTSLKTEVVNSGGTATPPNNPTRTGYRFISWSGTYTNVTSNQTVTATYAQFYQITFNSNGGSPTYSSIGFIEDELVNLDNKNPQRSGYYFDGWVADWQDSQFTDGVWDQTVGLYASDVYFTAQWEVDTAFMEYNQGYEDGKAAGILEGEEIGYEDGYKDALDYAVNQIWNKGFTGFMDYNLTDQTSFSYRLGRQSVPKEEMAITDFIPGLVGVFFGFFFQLASISVLGISLLDILALIFSFGILIIIIKIFVTKG